MDENFYVDNKFETKATHEANKAPGRGWSKVSL